MFVPGRLCLVGEHSDWAASREAPGSAVVVATSQGIEAEVVGTSSDWREFSFISQTPTGDEVILTPTTDTDALTPHDWAEKEMQGSTLLSYVAGCVWAVLAKIGPGFETMQWPQVEVTSATLPMGKGLSSSAALCVLAINAFASANGWEWDKKDRILLAWEGEVAAGSPCGLLDQVAPVFGPGMYIVRFPGDKSVEIEVVEEAEEEGGSISLVLVDLGGAKDTREILAGLQSAFPHASTPAEMDLHTLLVGDRNVQTVESVVAALKARDGVALGSAFAEAQQAFDAIAAPFCPDQLTSPLLHAVLEDAGVQSLSWGGKGVGSQGDGSAQLVARPGCVDELCAYVEGKWPSMSCVVVEI